MANWTVNEKSEGELKFTIEGDEWKKACKKAYNKLAPKVQVQGFRPGKAPKAMIDKLLPATAIYSEAMYDNINKWVMKEIENEGLIPLTRPELIPGNMNADSCEITVKMTVRPEAEVGDYKALKYELEVEEVTDDDVTAEIDRLRDRYADMIVKEGEAENGDTVNIDYVGYKDDVAFEGGEDHGHDLVLGSNTFIPGFEEQLIGTKAGDEKEVNVTFPENYQEASLAGQPAVFKVTVNEVKFKQLPEVDDDFAQDVNYPGVENVEQLKEHVRKRLEDNKKNTAESVADGKLLEELRDITTVVIPEVMIEEEVQNQVNGLVNQLQSYGMSLTSYLQMTGLDTDGFKNQFREQAETDVKTRLALEAVAKAEGMKATPEEIDEEMQSLADMYQMSVDQVRQYVDPNLVALDLTNGRAYEFVKKLAKEAAGIVTEDPKEETSEEE